MNPEQDLNQADPLDSLTQSVQSSMKQSMQKMENNGNLIVMLNNASAMEIEEIKNQLQA